MRIIFIVLFFVLLAGCKDDPEAEAKSGKLRIELFKQCMELAAGVNKATTQHYNDLDDVVGECSQQAYYMANHAA